MTIASVFGLAVNEHGALVRAAVVGRALLDVDFFGPVWQGVHPAASHSNGRWLGEGAWTAIGAEHVRLA